MNRAAVIAGADIGALVNFSRDFLHFQDAAQQAFGLAHEGWRMVTDVLEGGERRQGPYPRG